MNRDDIHAAQRFRRNFLTPRSYHPTPMPDETTPPDPAAALTPPAQALGRDDPPCAECARLRAALEQMTANRDGASEAYVIAAGERDALVEANARLCEALAAFAEEDAEFLRRAARAEEYDHESGLFVPTEVPSAFRNLADKIDAALAAAAGAGGDHAK